MTGIVAESRAALPDAVAAAAPPRLLDLVRRSGAWLVGKGIANGQREAEWIFAETLGLSRLDLYTRFDQPLDAAEVDRLRALIARRGKREPLAYVLGTQDFHGLRLHVVPGVLVPRPETEALIDLVLAALPDSAEPLRVLDVGTGSGAIALALKHARPRLDVHATDISREALAQASANAARLGLAVTFSEDHLARRHLASGPHGPFAAVVANLPYIGSSPAERAACDPELAFEPACALYAERDGLALIAELIADAPRLLAPQGTLWLEYGFAQCEAVAACARAAGLTAAILRDAAGHARYARIAR